MINDDLLSFLHDSFVQILVWGSSTDLFNIGGRRISINDFLLSLSIMSIVLVSLVNFVKRRSNVTLDRAVSIRNTLKSRRDSDD